MSERRFASIRVVILAGGFGTRVRHLLPDVPKPMAPVFGRPFVEWVVRFYAQIGLSDFVLSTGYLAEVVASHFARGPVPGVKVACCAETSPLGTAGGFLNCADIGRSAPEAWLVVNGDSLVCATPAPAIAAVQEVRCDAALLGLQVPDAARYGTLDVSSDGRLMAFREKRPGAGIINAGVYVFSHAVVRRMPLQRPLGFEHDIFPQLATAGSVTVQNVAAPFLDIGTPETLTEAENFITANKSLFLP